MIAAQEVRVQERVRIQALGGYRIVVDGRDLRLRTRKEATLLLRLALAGDDGASRDECIGLLWPESSEARARHSLSEAMRGIELATGLEMRRTPERLALPFAVLGFDVRELEDAIASGDVAACAELYKGGFLAGWYPPTAEASHWVDGVAAAIATRLEKAMRRELAVRRQATDARGVLGAVALLELLGVATDEDREAGAEAEQVAAWESLRPGERVQSRIPLDREGPFVGRVEEMRVLTRELERAMAGELRVVLVSGEAGIGKTRTCQRLARLAALRGARLFMSTCYELEQAVAYGVITDVLRGVGASDVRELKPVFRQALTPFLPEVDYQNDGYVTPSLGTHITLQGIAALVASACTHKPGFLLVDDLQWVDASSCQILHFLLRALEVSVPAVVVFAFRTGEVEENASAQAIVRSAANAGALQLELSPLSIKDIEAQVAAFSPHLGEHATEIAETAAGNPFFARELALAYAPNDVSGSSVGEVILERANALMKDEAEVLTDLAVAAVPLTIDELADITGTSLNKQMAVVHALERKRLIRDVDGAVMVAHDLIRSAIYRSLSTAQKRARHSAIADALCSRGNPSLLAHHYSLGGQRESARRMGLLAAARSREAHDYTEEVRLLRLALDNTTTAVTSALDHATARMFAMGRFVEAGQLLTDYARHSSAILRARKSVAALKALSTQDLPSAYAACDKVFDESVRANAGLEAVEALREKMRLAQESSANSIVLETVDRLEAFGTDWPDFGIAVHARAIALLKLTGFSPSAVSARLVKVKRDIECVAGGCPSDVLLTLNLVDALNCYNEGEVVLAGVKFHAAISESRSTGDLLQELRARSLLVPISMEAMRFSRAIRHAQFVIDYASFEDASWEYLIVLVNYAALLWEAGDLAGAQSVAAKGLESERKRPMWAASSYFLAVQGLCALETGHVEDARGHMEALLDHLPPMSAWVSDMSLPVVFLSRALRTLGRDEEAVMWLEGAIEHCAHQPRISYWTVRLELASIRLGANSNDEAEVVRQLRSEAAQKGCRLVVAKCDALLSGLRTKRSHPQRPRTWRLAPEEHQHGVASVPRLQ